MRKVKRERGKRIVVQTSRDSFLRQRNTVRIIDEKKIGNAI